MTKRLFGVGLASVAAVLLFLAGPASAQYQPTSGQVLSASVVSPGQTITVSGFGCAAGSSVTTRFDTTVVRSTTAGSNGRFSVQVTIPTSASAGMHQINSTCGSLVLSSTVTVRVATTGGTSTGGTSGGTATGGTTAGSSTGGTAGGALARTGTDSGLYLRLGFALVAAGGVFLMVARTRRRGLAA